MKKCDCRSAEDFRARLGASGVDFDDLQPESQVGVANEWWTDAWIPFAANGGGDLLCLDSNPPKGGKKWQVVKFVHDGPERAIVAPSFGAWLGLVADAVANGDLSDLTEP